jgi:hypothetical protein
MKTNNGIRAVLGCTSFWFRLGKRNPSHPEIPIRPVGTLTLILEEGREGGKENSQAGPRASQQRALPSPVAPVDAARCDNVKHHPVGNPKRKV